MNIKDIETQSGMTRANIRFYEQEGPLSPQRQSNGYRDYSDADLETLQRIRLLRTLGLGIEEIRALQKGETTLQAALAQQTLALEQQAAQLQRRQQVCRDICRDNASYETLDAQRWLNALEEDASTPTVVPAADAYEKVRAPWRRFFARYFDLTLYSSIWIALGFALLHRSPSTETGSAWMGAASIVSVVLMVLIEPLFLCTWGTTPGKWLLGLQVRGNAGQKLDYMEGIYRTVQALWYGFGFFVPIYNLVRGYHCYYDCTDGKTLPWEWDSELQLKDEKPWRIAAYVGGVAALLSLVVLVGVTSAAPDHRGDMTVAEFADSFNRQATYYDFELWLDEKGRWTEKPRPDGGYVINMSDIEPPDFVYAVENGLMTGLTLTLTVEGDTESWVPIFENHRILAILAFAQAYDPTPLNNDEVVEIINRLEQYPARALDETVHGVRITWTLESTGYHVVDTMGVLVPIEGETPSCSMTFTMKKVS